MLIFKMAAKGEAVPTSIANRISQIDSNNGAYRNATEDDCYRLIEEQKNVNTKRKTDCDIMKFQSWLKLKEENREIQEIPPSELDKLIATYLIDIRPPDSKKLEYEPETLISKYNSISRYLKEKKIPGKHSDKR